MPNAQITNLELGIDELGWGKEAWGGVDGGLVVEEGEAGGLQQQGVGRGSAVGTCMTIWLVIVR